MINKELQKRILSSIILIPLAFYFIIHGSYMLIFFTFICFSVACYEWHKMTKRKTFKIYGFPFLIFSFYTFYVLSLELVGVFFVITICVSTDIGGYVFGKIFKGPKLTKISPNKTYAGMIGGYLFSIMFMSIFFNNLDFFSQIINISTSGTELTLVNFILVIVISTVSQLGDIIVSYFKRLSKIKNTGKIIPGHGGLLDRIDGMIFAFPVFYLITKIFY